MHSRERNVSCPTFESLLWKHKVGSYQTETIGSDSDPAPGSLLLLCCPNPGSIHTAKTWIDTENPLIALKWAGQEAEWASVTLQGHALWAGAAPALERLPRSRKWRIQTERRWVWVPGGSSARGACPLAPDRHVGLRHQPIRGPSGRKPLPGRTPNLQIYLESRAAARAFFARRETWRRRDRLSVQWESEL